MESQIFKSFRKPQFSELLLDPNIKRWFSNNSKGSVILADNYLRILGRFCKAVGLTPVQYSKLPRRKMEDYLQDYANGLEELLNPRTKRKYAPMYIETCVRALRNWAEWNGKPIQRKIKIANTSKRPTLEDERVPTSEELRRVLYADTTPLRTRVNIALMAFSGPRPEVQGNYLGLEGLRLKDFPELKLDSKEVSFAKIPTVLVVREELSKSHRKYITFLGDEGCEILKQYLERRISSGEKLELNSGVIVSLKQYENQRKRFKIEDQSPFLRTTKLSAKIRRAMRSVGLPWRPYVFRSYFDTNLMLAESKGLISHAYQQFWMGHTGDIEAQYTTNKNRLPENLIEDMRERYAKAARSPA